MNLTLKRNEYLATGIFGEFIDESGHRLAYTLEHAYPEYIGSDGSSETNWKPKLPPGTYTCVRGEHQLHSGPIETFEVTGVAGHSGILIHPGNTEGASEGCILVGMLRQGDAVISSKMAFQDFLDMELGKSQFILTVEA